MESNKGAEKKEDAGKPRKKTGGSRARSASPVAQGTDWQEGPSDSDGDGSEEEEWEVQKEGHLFTTDKTCGGRVGARPRQPAEGKGSEESNSNEPEPEQEHSDTRSTVDSQDAHRNRPHTVVSLDDVDAITMTMEDTVSVDTLLKEKAKDHASPSGGGSPTSPQAILGEACTSANESLTQSEIERRIQSL